MSIEHSKARVIEEIDRIAPVLLEASHKIHAHPELGFEERFACDLLTHLIVDHGIEVTSGAYGVETSFEARVGSGGAVVAILCEYDALPGIGHGCGHNVIAAAGLGAGLAAAAVAPACQGTVRLLGTPAEEGGGGKVRLLEAGAFDGIDAALMAHPAGADLERMNAIAIRQLLVTFDGASAHAAAAPWKGRNALDAAVIAYTNIAALRQHIRPDERVHGIFLPGADDKPNIVPSQARQHWYVRAGTARRLEVLEERVAAAIEAGGQATGCGVTIDWVEPAYAEMRDNKALVAAYVANAASIGRTVRRPQHDDAVVGSTDMGNISQVVPSIHPMIAVAPPDVAIHTEAFASCAAGPGGDQAVIDGAKILAMTAVDIWLSQALREAARSEFAGGLIA